MTNIFFYGSLMYSQILSGLLGQNNYKIQPAILSNHTRKQVRDKCYPGVVYQQEQFVEGKICYQISQQHKNILHHFQSLEYYAKQVEVVTKANGKTVDALVYIWLDKSRLQQNDWKQKQFEEKHLKVFVNNHLQTKEKYQIDKKYMQQ